MKKYLRFLWAMVALLLLQVLPAKSYAFYTYGGSEYQLVSAGGITWDNANTAAQALGTGWHLAVITSAAEETAVYENLVFGSGYEYWLGGYQNPITETNPTLGWTWVTGEPWSYANWAATEPNDYWGPGSDQYVAIRGTPADGWNDTGYPTSVATDISGYVAERNVPEPATLLLYGLGFAVSAFTDA